MKITRSLLLFAVALTATAASVRAQNGRKDHLNNWFIGAGAGMNFGFDGQNYRNREASHNGAGTAADFYFGKYFTDGIGFRIGYQGFQISNQYVDYGKDQFHYAHADLLWRAGNVLVPYIHAGYVHVASGTPAGGIGLMVPIRVGSRISIIPDIKATAFDGAAFTGGTRKLGVNVSATVGLQVALGKIKKKAAPAPSETYPVPVPFREPAKDTMIITVHDTVTVVKEKFVEIIREKEEQINRSLAETVLFEFDAYTLTAAARNILDDAAAFLKEYSATTARVEGHTDSIGSDRYNLNLSANRAHAVVNYLISCGIESSRVSSEGYGEYRPVAPNATKEGRARNRRVEIRIDMKQ